MRHSTMQAIAPDASEERFYIIKRSRAILPGDSFTIFQSTTAFSLQRPPDMTSVLDTRAQRPDVSSLQNPPTVIRPGDIYIHRNTAFNANQAWIAGLGGSGVQWVDITRNQHSGIHRHPRLPKVLVWRDSDGSPSWVTPGHFNAQLRLPQTISVPLSTVVSSAPGHRSGQEFWA